MIKVTCLGTSGSTPTKERSLPAVALEYEGGVYIFDCGEGMQRQAMEFSVNISKIKAIFITHTHGDHILGLPGLVRTMALNRRVHPLEIYVPEGEQKKVDILLTFDRALIGYKIIVKGVKSGVICKGDGFKVSAFKLNHTVPTYGYSFESEDKFRFIKEKCAKLGIKGTMFGELSKKGSIKIKNKTIKLKDVTYVVPGKKIVYAADTRPTESTSKAAKGADLLMHESSFANKLKELAKERSHCTAQEAAIVAKKAKCKRLLLFHMSARYKNTNELLKEARAIFKNSEVANDGMVISI